MLLRKIIETYAEPGRTLIDLHDPLKSPTGVDPSRESSEAAREELSRLTPTDSWRNRKPGELSKAHRDFNITAERHREGILARRRPHRASFA
jgi:hypothetical protein